MGDDIRLVTIGGRKMWDCGDRLLPLVAGADGEGEGEGKGGDGDKSGESKSSMIPEGEEGKGEGEGKGGEGKTEDKRSDLEKALDAQAEKMRAELDEREKKTFDRLADASGKQLRNLLKGHLGDKGDEGKGDEGKGKGEAKPDPEAAARAEADAKRLLRDSRSAFKDILGDDVKFLGAPERELAMTLGSGLIVQAIGGGESDEEAIGRNAAQTVAKQLREARKFYEARTRAGLKRDGLLVETPGQNTRSATAPQADTAFKRGAEIAQAKYGKPKEPART